MGRVIAALANVHTRVTRHSQAVALAGRVRGVARCDDLLEAGVAALEIGSTAPDAEPEGRGVHRRGISRIERQHGHAAPKEVSAVGGAGHDDILRLRVQHVHPGGAAVGRFIDAERGRARRCEPAAGHCGESVAGDVGADVEVAGVGGIDEDRPDRPVLADRHATADETPAGSAVGRLEEADPGFGVGRAVGLAGADIEGVAAGVVGVDNDRPDRVGGQPIRGGVPAG